MKAKQQRDKEFADLPSPEDCESASKGAQPENADAGSGNEAQKSTKSTKSPKKK